MSNPPEKNDPLPVRTTQRTAPSSAASRTAVSRSASSSVVNAWAGGRSRRRTRTSPSSSRWTKPCPAAALPSQSRGLLDAIQLLSCHQQHLVGRLGCRIERPEVEEQAVVATERD